MKKCLEIGMYVCAGLIIVGVFILMMTICYKFDQKRFIEFRAEALTAIEDIDLSDYEYDKYLFKIGEYKRSDNSHCNGLPCYSVDGFMRYLQKTDYDFYYRIYKGSEYYGIESNR